MATSDEFIWKELMERSLLYLTGETINLHQDKTETQYSKSRCAFKGLLSRWWASIIELRSSPTDVWQQIAQLRLMQQDFANFMSTFSYMTTFHNSKHDSSSVIKHASIMWHKNWSWTLQGSFLLCKPSVSPRNWDICFKILDNILNSWNHTKFLLSKYRNKLTICKPLNFKQFHCFLIFSFSKEKQF